MSTEQTWVKARKSSDYNGCVEISWRTASKSAGNGACVEVAQLPPLTLIRDSKNPHQGYLTLTPQAFGDLLRFAREHG
jgi:hypothetical protein